MIGMYNVILLCLTLVPAQVFAATKDCPYSASPINWVMQYCAFRVGTGDEVVIQRSDCFKNASVDLKNKDACLIKKNYKQLYCQERMKSGKEFKSVDLCLKDNAVTPFFTGN